MECNFFGNFLLRFLTIHAAGDKWADHGGSALPPTTDHRPPTTDNRQPTTERAGQLYRFKGRTFD